MDTFDNSFEDLCLPEDAYELVRQVKHLDGRIDFLTGWAGDIKKRIAMSPANYDGREFSGPAGPRKLRVTARPAGVSHRFQYDRFIASQPPDVVRRVLNITPPPRKYAVRLGAMKAGRSKEWAALALEGRKAEAALFPHQQEWMRADHSVIADGLFMISGKADGYAEEREALRVTLAEMAEAQRWSSGKWGKTDGRLLLTPLKEGRELRDRKAALRQYPGYVNLVSHKASTAVGFYPVGSTEDQAGQ